jgi:hypothetical protein
MAEKNVYFRAKCTIKTTVTQRNLITDSVIIKAFSIRGSLECAWAIMYLRMEELSIYLGKESQLSNPSVNYKPTALCY